jgi:hypothetical protein
MGGFRSQGGVSKVGRRGTQRRRDAEKRARKDAKEIERDAAGKRNGVPG